MILLQREIQKVLVQQESKKKYDYCKEVEVEKLIPNNIDETKNFQRHINKI